MTAAADGSPALERALAALVYARVVPHMAAALDRRVGELGPELRETVTAEVPAFSASGNPELATELDRHAREHVDELRRLLGGGAIGDFAFVRAHAHRRAEQHFPLEATLHAYRCGHKVLSGWMRDAAIATRRGRREQVVSAVADFAIEYTNTISTIVAAEYVAHTRALTQAEGDRRTELLGLLLSGYDEADARVARLLKRAGYLEQRQRHCVALAQSVDPLEMEHPARVQRIAESLAGAVAATPIRALVGVRSNVVTGVFSDARRVSGWTAPQADLAERLRSALLVLGPSVLIGIGGDQPSTSFIPHGLHEATVALDFASVGQRVVCFSELPIRRLLLHRGGDYVQAALPAWFAAFRDANLESRGALVGTLRALADADMNVQQAARALRVHPNTMYARLQRIAGLTGLDGLKYHDLSELLLAVDCGRM